MAQLDHGDYDPSTRTLLVRKGKNGKSRMLPVGERAAAWLDRFLAESRPLFQHLPYETALFLTGYGERFSPAYLGNWLKKLLQRCGIDKPGSCHFGDIPAPPTCIAAAPTSATSRKCSAMSGWKPPKFTPTSTSRPSPKSTPAATPTERSDRTAT